MFPKQSEDLENFKFVLSKHHFCVLYVATSFTNSKEQCLLVVVKGKRVLIDRSHQNQECFVNIFLTILFDNILVFNL